MQLLLYTCLLRTEPRDPRDDGKRVDETPVESERLTNVSCHTVLRPSCRKGEAPAEPPNRTESCEVEASRGWIKLRPGMRVN